MVDQFFLVLSFKHFFCVCGSFFFEAGFLKQCFMPFNGDEQVCFEQVMFLLALLCRARNSWEVSPLPLLESMLGGSRHTRLLFVSLSALPSSSIDILRADVGVINR